MFHVSHKGVSQFTLLYGPVERGSATDMYVACGIYANSHPRMWLEQAMPTQPMTYPFRHIALRLYILIRILGSEYLNE